MRTFPRRCRPQRLGAHPAMRLSEPRITHGSTGPFRDAQTLIQDSVDPSVPVACSQQLRHRRMEYIGPSSFPAHLGQSDRLGYKAEHEILESRPGDDPIDMRPNRAYASRTSTLGPERGACNTSPSSNELPSLVHCSGKDASNPTG